MVSGLAPFEGSGMMTTSPLAGSIACTTPKARPAGCAAAIPMASKDTAKQRAYVIFITEEYSKKKGRWDGAGSYAGLRLITRGGCYASQMAGTSPHAGGCG